MAESREPITQVLDQIHRGDADAKERLVAIVYDEVRLVASRMMKKERRDHTLQATALVHEAMVKILGNESIERMPNRAYLYATLTNVMRQVLIDHARSRAARKRQGGYRKVGLDEVLHHFEEQDLEVVAVHEALEALAVLNERQSQVMSLRFFGGMSMKEIADQLGVSLSTVESDFRLARAWLHASLMESGL